MQHLSTAPLLISAIIPVAGFPNGTKQIESWLADSGLSSFEVIFVIDSGDEVTQIETERIARELSNLTTVRIINSDSRNPGGTRNLGLTSARGDWIVFWDCDDVPDPSRFLEMIKQAIIAEASVAIGEFCIQSESHGRVKTFNGASRNSLLESIAVNPGVWRFAIKSQLARSINFPNMRMAEDQIYLANILELDSNVFVFKGQVYTYWQYRSRQLTKSSAALDQIVIALDTFLDKYREKQCMPILIVIIRLTFSAVRKASIEYKIKAISRLLFVCFRYPRQLPNILRAIRSIRDSR
jgi:glycosyltransferase involved in cell wall biosynthesis